MQDKKQPMDIVHKERVQSLETSYIKVMANVSFQEEETGSLNET